MSPADVRSTAKLKRKGICGVYKGCDGDPSRLCQNQIFGAGAQGVCVHMEHIRQNLAAAMLMTDCPSITDIAPAILETT
ncbi:MAG: hypothetical protein ACNA71_04885 [Kiritimatiellia bacterium]